MSETYDLSSIAHPGVRAFVAEYAQLCKPAAVAVCDGSAEEAGRLCDVLVDSGVFTRVQGRDNCFLARSDPRDVARTEERTVIATETQAAAGPTNNWRDPSEMKAMMAELYDGCMAGRTMYVIPYTMGPLNGPISHIGIELTDSEYVVVNMRIMTVIGADVLAALGTDGDFVRNVHSVRSPVGEDSAPCTWPCDPDNRWIVHYPQENLAQSVGSGYGGNALMSKKVFALRLASAMGRRDMWLAEHMLILGITDPQGNKVYISGAFPSQCGKTNLAMLKSSLPGWSIETVGDDIAWLKWGDDGRLYAINPEAGLFGVAPGTAEDTNPHALAALDKNCIFTNVALLPDGNVWWEGLTDGPPPPGTINWRGKVHDPESGLPAAHPNARFTAPIRQCPVLDVDGYDSLQGVPISAMLFGGRRPGTVPLVYASRGWEHGVLVGASVSSQKTAAADGSDIGVIRHDPFAMIPFCGYDMAEYFKHWLAMGAVQGAQLPRIFMVNWFRQDPESGAFMWPGFGENSRVLAWIAAFVMGNTELAVETPIGFVPKPGSIDLTGLDASAIDMDALLRVDPDAWASELDDTEKYLTDTFGADAVAPLLAQLATTRAAFAAANITPAKRAASSSSPASSSSSSKKQKPL